MEKSMRILIHENHIKPNIKKKNKGRHKILYFVYCFIRRIKITFYKLNSLLYTFFYVVIGNVRIKVFVEIIIIRNRSLTTAAVKPILISFIARTSITFIVFLFVKPSQRVKKKKKKNV